MMKNVRSGPLDLEACPNLPQKILCQAPAVKTAAPAIENAILTPFFQLPSRNMLWVR
jgi:hypothetical protein